MAPFDCSIALILPLKMLQKIGIDMAFGTGSTYFLSYLYSIFQSGQNKGMRKICLLTLSWFNENCENENNNNNNNNNNDNDNNDNEEFEW